MTENNNQLQHNNNQNNIPTVYIENEEEKKL